MQFLLLMILTILALIVLFSHNIIYVTLHYYIIIKNYLGNNICTNCTKMYKKLYITRKHNNNIYCMYRNYSKA